MNKTILCAAAMLASIMPLQGQEWGKFAFDIGGGISAPLNPTAQYVGLSGNFVVGAGYNITKHHSIIPEFMWSGLPPNLTVIQPVNAPFGNINLYSLTTNYRFQEDRIGHSPFGVYFIGGGGWYDRYATVSKDYTIPPTAVCQPIYSWWGYGCTTGGFVYTATVAKKGWSMGGVNAGVGFTVRIADSGFKFYVESRYHYAFSEIPTTLIPVTFGFRFN